MSDVTKEKIIQINTTNATKNVKSLKQQIKELKEQLSGLEQGTEEYDRVAKQLADTNQKQIEINEAMKYSNQDFGATLGNLARVSAGVIGAIQGINVVMQMFGASEEDAAKATQTLQQSMALIQSIGAIDTATKALKGLSVSFGNLGKNTTKTRELANAEKNLANSVTKTTGAEKNETAQIKLNTNAKNTNAKATTTMATRTNILRTGITTLTTGIKSMTKALLTNPFTIFIGASAAVMTIITNLIQKNKELKEAAEEHRKAELERAKALNNLPTDFTMVENSVKWANSGMEELTNSSSELYNEIRNIAGEIQKNDPSKKSQAWKLAFEQVYEEAAKNGDKEKQRLIELTRLQWERYRVNRANYETEAEYLKALDAATAKLYATYVSQQKSANNSSNTTKKTLKELIDLFTELRDKVVELDLSFNQIATTNDTILKNEQIFVNKFKSIVEKSGISDAIQKEFLDIINHNLVPLPDAYTSYNLPIDVIFKQEDLDKLNSDLEIQRKKLGDIINGTIKATEKEYNAQKKVVADLEKQLNIRNDIFQSYKAFMKSYEEEMRTIDKINEKEDDYNHLVETTLTYYSELRNNNPFAETNKAIADSEYEMEKLIKLVNEYDRELDKLANEPITQESANREYELLQIRKDAITELYNTQIKLEDAYYQQRLIDIQNLRKEEDEKLEKTNQKLENRRSAFGGGVVDYNTDVDILENERRAILSQLENVKAYFNQEISEVKASYDDLLAAVEEGSDEFLRIESERDEQLMLMEFEYETAKTQLEEEESNKRAEITQAEFERKARIQQAYMNTLSSITSQISSLLGEKMGAYDADSKEYKRLQIAQATINTVSGALAAFVSGFQSGIPFPGNLAAALALSGLVFATGAQSIENIKKESLKNSATSTATSGNFGDYDTLSYMNDVDLLSSIQDQRVWVAENDISTTQNRVRVRESEATF